MKYLQKSFSLPVSEKVTQEEWDAIFITPVIGEYVDTISLEWKNGKLTPESFPQACVHNVLGWCDECENDGA